MNNIATARVSPRWENAGTVEGFATSEPNFDLMDYARLHLSTQDARILDIGGGAGRNAVPLAQMGYRVTCTDLSAPMLSAARQKAQAAGVEDRIELVETPMHILPFDDDSFDLIIAHGVWNLARRDAEFRTAISEAARVAREGAALFVFTFSRNTLPENCAPEEGERFTFKQFNGEPCCFLRDGELVEELARVGFHPNAALPLTELNVPPAPRQTVGGPPVIYQAGFIFKEKS